MPVGTAYDWAGGWISRWVSRDSLNRRKRPKVYVFCRYVAVYTTVEEEEEEEKKKHNA